MAKIYGLFGSMTGKLADTVMAVRNGEQIARKYQPVVSNPNTPAQVAVRAKLKLMSQLSAVMAPYIAMPRQGAVSSRNIFTKENFKSATYSENMASITLTNVKLTKSVVSLPPLEVTREGASITVGLDGNAGVVINRVVYALFRKMADNTLRAVESKVIDAPGSGNSFTATFTAETASGDFVIYAYGVRDNTEAARAVFGNMEAPVAETIAKLVVTRTLTESDITLTETQAVESNHSREIDPDREKKNTSNKK